MMTDVLLKHANVTIQYPATHCNNIDDVASGVMADALLKRVMWQKIESPPTGDLWQCSSAPHIFLWVRMNVYTCACEYMYKSVCICMCV